MMIMPILNNPPAVKERIDMLNQQIESMENELSETHVTQEAKRKDLRRRINANRYELEDLHRQLQSAGIRAVYQEIGCHV